jgi:hypothetical protein
MTAEQERLKQVAAEEAMNINALMTHVVGPDGSNIMVMERRPERSVSVAPPLGGKPRDPLMESQCGRPENQVNFGKSTRPD